MSIRAASLLIITASVALNAEGQAMAAVPDRLCGAKAEVAPYPASDSLLQVAAQTEMLLASRAGSADPSVEALRILEVPFSATELPSPEARAAYCSAAGEVMRVGSQGSQYQAQSYFLTAVRSAQQAGSMTIGSRAAYRLGMVSQAGLAVPGARGARGRSRSTSLREVASDTAQVALTRRTDDGACDQLLRADVVDKTNAILSLLSFECAAARAEASGQFDLSALAKLRLARLGLQFIQSAPEAANEVRPIAVRNAFEGLEAAKRVALGTLRSELVGRLAFVLVDLGETADPLLNEAPSMMRAADASAGARGFAAALSGRLALATGQRLKAASLFRQAILLEHQRTLPARLPEWHLLLGDADPAARSAHVASAYRALEAVRPLLPRLDPLTEETAFSLYMRRVFESAADVQLASAANDEGAGIRAAQEIVETYRQAELQSVFGSECVPPREPLKPQELRAGEVLLYPLLLPDRIELLYAVGGGDGTYKRLPSNHTAGRNAVSRLVEQMVVSISYGDDDAWRAPARQLYELLIKPVEHELGPGSILAIIPDGPLRSVPFAALLGDDGRFLVQRTRLTIAPSLAYSQPGSGGGKDVLSVFAASLQKELDLPAGYFPRLEGTAAEAQIAAGSARNSLYIADFQKADLIGALNGNNFDILHLATHASFNGRSDRAFIVADGGVIMLSELRDLIANNRTRGEELDLLILSACETAVGDDEASMGLAGAAVQAGAKSAIASLWQVNDAGTAELMRQFYSRLRDGRSKSASIRDAQLSLIAGGGENANPNIWAAFTLLGAWR